MYRSCGRAARPSIGIFRSNLLNSRPTTCDFFATVSDLCEQKPLVAGMLLLPGINTAWEEDINPK